MLGSSRHARRTRGGVSHQVPMSETEQSEAPPIALLNPSRHQRTVTVYPSSFKHRLPSSNSDDDDDDDDWMVVYSVERVNYYVWGIAKPGH